jgi:hypothetical protein
VGRGARNSTAAGAASRQASGRRRFRITLKDGSTYSVRAADAEQAGKIALRRAARRTAGQPVRQRTISQRTDAEIEVLDADHPGSDVDRAASERDGDADAGRWVTVCRTHGGVCNHSTLALARSFAAAPEEWCEECREIADQRKRS